jgi:hypothetical protein
VKNDLPRLETQRILNTTPSIHRRNLTVDARQKSPLKPNQRSPITRGDQPAESPRKLDPSDRSNLANPKSSFAKITESGALPMANQSQTSTYRERRRGMPFRCQQQRQAGSGSPERSAPITDRVRGRRQWEGMSEFGMISD